MKLSAAVLDYCEYGRYDPEIGHAHSTYLGYKNRLEQFQRWCAAQGFGDPEVKQIDLVLLRKYSLHVAASGVRPRTHRQHIHALRFLFNQLVNQGQVEVDPMKERHPDGKLKLPLAKLDDAYRKLVGEDDLERLWEAALRQSDDFKAIRDRAVLSVLIFTAIRRGGLLGLKVEDVNLREKVLKVREKGSKVRQVPLCEEVCEDLANWLALRQRLPAKHDKLFCVDRCRPLGENGLAALVKDVAAIAGLKEGNAVKPHTLRHAAATRFLNNGASLKDCQVLLGHSDLKTTALYLHADEQSIRPMAALLGFQKDSVSPPSAPPAKPASKIDQRVQSLRRRAVR